MAKYFDSEKALAFPFANGNYDSKNANADFILGCQSYREYLESIPAADVRPVVRGEWVRHYTRPNVYEDLYWHCTVCGYKNGNNYANVYHSFCPNCGADMRGDDNGD